MSISIGVTGDVVTLDWGFPVKMMEREGEGAQMSPGEARVLADKIRRVAESTAIGESIVLELEVKRELLDVTTQINVLNLRCGNGDIRSKRPSVIGTLDARPARRVAATLELLAYELEANSSPEAVAADPIVTT